MSERAKERVSTVTPATQGKKEQMQSRALGHMFTTTQTIYVRTAGVRMSSPSSVWLSSISCDQKSPLRSSFCTATGLSLGNCLRGHALLCRHKDADGGGERQG